MKQRTKGLIKYLSENKKQSILIGVVIVLFITISIIFWKEYFLGYDGYISIDDKNLYKISLCEDKKNMELKIPLPDDFTGDAEDLDIEIVRNEEHEYINLKDAFSGGNISKWKTQSTMPLFSNIKKEICDMEEGDLSKRQLRITMDTNCYFYTTDELTGKLVPDYSVPHTNDGSYLALCGYFNVNACVNGDIVGSTTAKILPYNSYRTMDEIAKEVSYLAKLDSDFYVEEFSLGQSSGGRNIPYLIVADKRSSVSRWLDILDEAKDNPSKVKEMVEKGHLKNLKVPVLFSNVHGNEVASSDGILNFASKLISGEPLDYKVLSGFTERGQEELSKERGPEGQKDSVAISELIKEDVSYLGYLTDGNVFSDEVNLESLYKIKNNQFTPEELLEEVFFIIVPTENPDGREGAKRNADNGYDLNRDSEFQTASETQAMLKMIGKYNPVSFVEFHGRIEEFQCEPCTPPHQANFEYDLLAENLVKGGEALGNAAVSNNRGFNSYVMPVRDYLYYTGEKTEAGKYETYWEYPWDDMSTGYTPQFAMLHGTLGYTVELPAYNEDAVDAVTFGMIGHASYVAENKMSYLFNLFEFFERGVSNFNSNGFEEAGKWFTNQNDQQGAEIDIFRPIYSGEGENGNFYPECYLIPLDGENQENIQGALDMLLWLTRNDVKVYSTKKEFVHGDKTYPAGSLVVPMYQAKRSVANSALYKGTFLNSWTMLYSEDISAFNLTRGFNMEVITQRYAYDQIAETLNFNDPFTYESASEYSDDFSTVFSGEKDGDVIIFNTSETAVSSVNYLLHEGKNVGMITEGQYKGNYVCSYDDYIGIRKKFVVTSLGIKRGEIKGRVITKAPSVYITGNPANVAENQIHTNYSTDCEEYFYDLLAMKIMGFDTTNIITASDIILGSSSPEKEELSAVEEGKPYMGYGSTSVDKFDIIEGLSKKNCADAMDCLGYVTYPNESLVNASYIRESDNILYGYGVGFFDSVPQGAKVLVAMENKTPVQGFVPLQDEEQRADFQQFLNGSVQGFEYTGQSKNGKTIDMVLFANSLTSRGHQRDEYAFISNFIFSRMLGGEYINEG